MKPRYRLDTFLMMVVLPLVAAAIFAFLLVRYG